jgi:hypothetical protein
LPLTERCPGLPYTRIPPEPPFCAISDCLTLAVMPPEPSRRQVGLVAGQLGQVEVARTGRARGQRAHHAAHMQLARAVQVDDRIVAAHLADVQAAGAGQGQLGAGALQAAASTLPEPLLSTSRLATWPLRRDTIARTVAAHRQRRRRSGPAP